MNFLPSNTVELQEQLPVHGTFTVIQSTVGSDIIHLRANAFRLQPNHIQPSHRQLHNKLRKIIVLFVSTVISYSHNGGFITI